MVPNTLSLLLITLQPFVAEKVLCVIERRLQSVTPFFRAHNNLYWMEHAGWMFTNLYFIMFFLYKDSLVISTHLRLNDMTVCQDTDFSLEKRKEHLTLTQKQGNKHFYCNRLKNLPETNIPNSVLLFKTFIPGGKIHKVRLWSNRNESKQFLITHNLHKYKIFMLSFHYEYSLLRWNWVLTSAMVVALPSCKYK